MFALKELTGLLSPTTLAGIVADLGEAFEIPEADLTLHDMRKAARHDAFNTLVALVGHDEAEAMVATAAFPLLRVHSEED